MSTDLQMPSPGAARSFWLQEALANDPGEPAPPLTANLVADICIVGGGFAGLWTAVELSRRAPDLRVVLVERDICGGGASGRNGGFFSSSWWDVQGICALFGETEGIRYAHAVADTVGEVGVWLDEHDVDAWFHHDGILGIQTGEWQGGLGADGPAEFLAARGLADRMRPIEREDARKIADSPRIINARSIDDAAVVQPARLARGLRRVALSQGVHIFERTNVTGLERSRPAVVRTDHGAIRADQVVLTMGAWAAGWPGFRRSFAVVADHMVVTEPIPELREEIGWTSNTGIADGRELLFYLRPTDDDRIAIGGGGLSVVFGGRAGGRAATHDRRVAEVAARGLLWLFPQLDGVRFTHAWGGPIDQTSSYLPFFTTLEPGTIHAGLGFSGHGLSQTMLGGRILTSLVLGETDEWTSLPVVGPEIGKVPPEPFRYAGVTLAARALEWGDRRQDAGRSRGVIPSLLGDAPGQLRERLTGNRTDQ
ncbi:MAG TPA: FAD-dependent oxidoreductase [Actinomycetota bacterium]